MSTKLVALCKTNSCNEFIEAAIEAIYEDMSKIVFVHSDYNWLGQFAKDEVREPITAWKKQFDKKGKIIQLEFNSHNVTQEAQYNLGYIYIQEHFIPDWVFVFDSDEVWDYENIRRLKKYANKSYDYNCIGSNMYTYLKSPFFRVDPAEWCKPTVLFRPCRRLMQGIRGNNFYPKLIPEDLYFHHYTYVREKEEDIFKKIWTSLQGDKEEVQGTSLVDIDKWKEEKWNALPYSKNLHTTKGAEKSWNKIKIIGMDDVPVTLRNKAIIKQFTKG